LLEELDVVAAKNLQVMFVLLSATLSLAGCSGRTILQEDKCPSARQSLGKHDDAKVAVWFVRASGADLKLVGVDREVNTNADPMSEAIGCLLHGPLDGDKDNGLASEIPRGTILLGVQEVNDEIELNLSKRFTAGGEGTSLETRIEQLRRTIDPIASGRKVYLDIEGKRLSVTNGEGLEVKQPIN
jgi:spore germination protein GerM